MSKTVMAVRVVMVSGLASADRSLRYRVSVDLTDGSKEFVELSQVHSAFQGIKIRVRTRLRIVD